MGQIPAEAGGPPQWCLRNPCGARVGQKPPHIPSALRSAGEAGPPGGLPSRKCIALNPWKPLRPFPQLRLQMLQATRVWGGLRAHPPILQMRRLRPSQERDLPKVTV